MLNQCLNLDQVKNLINENKSKISSQIKESLEKTKEKINLAIKDLNSLLAEVEKESQSNEKYVNQFFDMLTFTYEKYYSMMNSPQLSLQVIKNMSSMKNLLNIKNWCYTSIDYRTNVQRRFSPNRKCQHIQHRTQRVYDKCCVDKQL